MKTGDTCVMGIRRVELGIQAKQSKICLNFCGEPLPVGARANVPACLNLFLLTGIHICTVKREYLVTQKPVFIFGDMCMQFCGNKYENVSTYRLKCHPGHQFLQLCANTLAPSKQLTENTQGDQSANML